ncbi:MAG: recombinase family protein [Desulfobacterales bacterium]|jgi:DNA invertase Pin-like site-specific DNA recombinase|nr:recombinase family protein [Desulfobacterales bacterium]
MKDKKIRAVGYIKAPTGRVKEVNPNPEAQEEKIKVYAESEGLDMVRVYREKVLGSNIVNKDELDQIYRDISEGNADTILIYKGDRVTRRWSINRLNKEKYEGDSEEI